MVVKKKLLTIQEAATALGLKYGRLRLWCESGRIKAQEFPVSPGSKRKLWRIPVEEVRRLEEQAALGIPVGA
jgi:excisionase family DNA binding protein